jgi:small subunit ribosomal protein S6
VTAYEIMLLLGSWQSDEPWGRRKLAYEIRHKDEAFYYLLHLDCDAETLEELTRVLKITDGVVRHLAVRRPVSRRARESVPGGQ